MSTKQPSSKPYAEVISSNLSTFTAQCWQWDQGPTFGDLVCAQHGELAVYGIVNNIQTGSNDPQRTPFAYQKTHEELKAQHPQIFEFLATTFFVTVVGFERNGVNLRYTTAPQPTHIHSFVTTASIEQRHRFYTNPAFLPLLFATPPGGPALDELLLAVCNHIANTGMLTPTLFEQYYHTFSLLIGNDYRRLKLLLARINAQHAQLLIKPKQAA